MLQKTLKWFMFADKERQFNGIKTKLYVIQTLTKLQSDTINIRQFGN